MDDVVLVPGLLCTEALFAPQVAALQAADCNTHVANLTRQDSIGAMADDVLRLVPGRFALAGLSLGGYVAFEVLRRAPDRVTRLALLNTNARADRPEQSAQRRDLVALADAEGLEAVQAVLRPRLVHAERLSDAALMARIDAMAFEIGVAAFRRQQEAVIARADNRPFLASIACPTLIVVGSQDVITPPKVAYEMADGIAGSHVVEIPDCGHLSTLECPEAVNAALLSWLETP